MSYVAVTVGTVMVLGALMVGISVMFENGISSRVQKSVDWSGSAFEDNIPYLMGDPAALQAWLARVQADGFTADDLNLHNVGESLGYANTLVTRTKPIFVLDPALNLIAAAPLNNSAVMGRPVQVNSEQDTGYENLLNSKTLGEGISIHDLNDGSYVVSHLLTDQNGVVVAIVIYTIKPVAFALPANFSYYMILFVAVSMLALVAILPIGAVFGWLASRGLRQRLGRLSLSANAWSKGDFSPAPRDKSADEIGELTRDLVNMAGQLQTLLHTRDELTRVEERNRLARDLHDTVKQQTYAARMQLSAAKNLLETNPKSAAERIKD